MITYALVLVYCTSKVECWRELPNPAETFATAAACRRALEVRARRLLDPHFEKDHLDITLNCEPSTEMAQEPAPRSGSTVAPRR